MYLKLVLIAQFGSTCILSRYSSKLIVVPYGIYENQSDHGRSYSFTNVQTHK